MSEALEAKWSRLLKEAAIGFLGAVLGALISTLGTIYISNGQLEEQEQKEHIL
ncbi:hypothetical protein [Thalassomonas viridans]|uniref:hypothetical protein n=1 Tax=Thalassomonas viridans TaxID=137584 RepID=UPI00137929FD|nr:hypothetical protein [Thalassomonas viridans]